MLLPLLPFLSWCCGSCQTPGQAALMSGEELAQLLGSAAAGPPRHPPRTLGLVPQDPVPLTQPHPNPMENPRKTLMAPGAPGSGSQPLPLQQGECFLSFGAEHKPEDNRLDARALLLARARLPPCARGSNSHEAQTSPPAKGGWADRGGERETRHSIRRGRPWAPPELSFLLLFEPMADPAAANLVFKALDG